MNGFYRPRGEANRNVSSERVIRATDGRSHCRLAVRGIVVVLERLGVIDVHAGTA